MSPGPLAAGGIPGLGGASGGGSTGGSGGGPGPGAGGMTPADALGGPPGPIATLARVLPPVVVTTGGVSMVMAFLVFKKRRRDEAQLAPDEVLGAAAALGSGILASSALVPGGAAVAALPMPASVVPGVDAHLPRWRRPSLMEARKADPMRQQSAKVRLTFDSEADTGVPGLERRLIRYRLVSLLDLPDEVRGTEIGVLDEGDEVLLLEKRGTYWRILCPDGTQGWLHKMVLGDVVIDSSVSGGDSWTSGDEGPSGGFEDVLRAYTKHRRQFGET